MLHERPSGRFPGTGDDIDDAFREADLLDELAEADGRQRSLLRGLEDDGAPGRQRWRNLPHGHAEGHVPRDDLTHHADGLGASVGVILAGARYGQRLTGQPSRPTGVVPQAIDGLRHIPHLRQP